MTKLPQACRFVAERIRSFRNDYKAKIGRNTLQCAWMNAWGDISTHFEVLRFKASSGHAPGNR